jgi:AcrR family transcriptional regulator
MNKPATMAKPTDSPPNSRAALLQAAKAVMEESGYAAVTSRRIAAKAGLKPQLVHYYFASMDDLLLELFRGMAKEMIDLQAQAIRSEHPLRQLWGVAADRGRRILLEQFLILSRYNPALQEEMARFGRIYRDEQIRFMAALCRENRLDPIPWTPEFLAILFNALARAISIEPSYGLELGNRQAREVVDYYIDLFDKAVPDPETMIKRLERENAALRARLAELTTKTTR